MKAAWPDVELGRVLKHRSEFITIDDTQTYQRCRVQLHARGIMLRDRLEGAAIKTKSQQVCRAGEFLVAEIDAKHGGFGIVPADLDGAIVSSHYFLFEIDEAQLDRRFLDFFIRTHDFRDQVEAQGSTNYAAIRPSHVLGYRIPLPSLPEQRRIVTRIEEIANKIVEAGELLEIAEIASSQLVSSVVKQLFASGGSAAWSPGRLEDWLTSCQYGTSEKADDDSLGIPVLRMGNIQDGQIDPTGLKYLDLGADDLRRFRLNRGDILVNRTNSAELVGKCAVFDLPGEYVFASYLIRLQVDRTRANPSLLAYYINSAPARSYLFANKKQMTGQANINSRTLLNLPIALPNLDEQDKLLKVIECVRQQADEVRGVQRQRRQELNALLPSLLDKAFRGEL